MDGSANKPTGNHDAALAQFCTGQKFIIQHAIKNNYNYYLLQFSDNVLGNESYDEIVKKDAKIKFAVVGNSNNELNYAVIFFLIKFTQKDTNPCQ